MGECHKCSCKDAGLLAAQAAGKLSGWKYAWWAAVIFMVPLITATIGAVLGGSDRGKQALGGVLGLLAGAGVARGMYLWRRPEV